MFSHRPVTTDDFEIICRFPSSAEELFYMAPTAAFPLSRDALRDIVAARESPTVLTWNNDPAAFASLYHCEAGQSCFIGNVIVAPDQRGKGAARELVNAMMEIARHRFAARDVRLSCFNANTGGLLLYAKLGFTPYAAEERRNSQGDRLALIHMRREL